MLYYDVTHLRHNALRPSISGVIRLDFEIARHFFRQPSGVRAIQYGVAGPSLVETSGIRSLIDLALDRHRSGGGAPRQLPAVLVRLRGGPAPPPRPKQRPPALRSYLRFLTPPGWLRRQPVEPGSVYLNAAQHAISHPMFFRWLDARPDVKAVFLIHDLLPLDYPEFWRAGYREEFDRAIDLLVRIGRGFIVTSEAVRERLTAEMARRGKPDARILCSSPPVFLGGGPPRLPEEVDLATIPYFVMLGMIEPRKNHLLVLNIWRQLVERGAPVPKLVIIGKRGWENEQVLDMLDRSPTLADHVVEVANLSDAEACVLVRNARALLFPSFGEGFGLSVAEALSVGTPVLASDLPVLRETSGGKALFRSPIDGPGWTEAILGLADRSSPLSAAARDHAAGFTSRPASAFLGDIERFVAGL